MICPHCKGRVPMKALWTATGLSGIVRPHCNSSLSPRPLNWLLLFVISFGLGEEVLYLLQRQAASRWIALLGFIVIFVGSICLAAPLVLKLRLKDDTASRLAPPRI